MLQYLFGSLLSNEPDVPWTKDGAENIGKKLIDMLEAGSYSDLRGLLTRRIRWLVSAKKLEASWKSILASQGKVVSVAVGEATKSGDATVVRFPLVFEKSAVAVVVRISATGYLTSIRAVPDYSSAPWSPPPYADESLFDEEEVTLGAADRAVPGSLALPHAPRAAAVMLQGSGPSDRNSSIGQLKPFKDLSWGLATRGIASVRFDKSTFAHPGKPMENPTLDDEYVHHACAAIALLRSRPELAGLPIVVLGHSLGGTVAPRVAKQDPSIAGLVILAGSTTPLHWAAIRQLQYLGTLEDKTHHVSKAVLDAATKQARFVDSPGLSLSTPSSRLPFDVPASYWLDLRDYDPVSTAAGLGKPMLLLQGGRDYQVTLKEDFVGWKVGLEGRGDVEFRVYADKNHLFRTGKGMSSPEEYNIVGGHVDGDVVEDVAGWIGGLCGGGGEGEAAKTGELAQEIEVPKAVEAVGES